MPKSEPEPDWCQPKHNAPVSIVHAAKASLKDPTRPMTPSDYGRQLFSRDSEFAQNRPPSAYGMPSSNAFFDGGSKLNIAKMDPFARRSLGAEGGPTSSMSAQRSILASGGGSMEREMNGGDGYSPYRRSSSGTGLQRSYSGSREQQQQSSPSGVDQGNTYWPQSWGAGATPEGGAGKRFSQSRGSRGNNSQQGRTPTAAETVAALKANMAAMELGQRMGCEPITADEYEEPITDPNRNDDLPPRPTTSRGRPSSSAGRGFQAEMASSFTRPGRMPAPSSVEGAQVLEVGDSAQLSDSSDDDQTYQHLYNYGPSVTSPSPQQQQQQHSTPTSSGRPPVPSSQQPRPSTSAPAADDCAPMFGPKVLDTSEQFIRWRAGVDTALRGLAAATNALAALGSSNSNNSGSGGAASNSIVSAKEATAQLQQHSGSLVELAETLRKQASASKWLNSSSACVDASGNFLTLREAIAEHVYRLMDSHNTELLMKACSVVLRVVKSRGPLLQAGKLLYRLSKDSNNDPIFRRERLLEPIVRIIQIMITTAAASSSAPTPSAGHSNLFEPLVYFCGTLKNVTNDASNQRALVKAGALQVLSTALSITVAQVKATPDSNGAQNATGPSPGLLPCSAPNSGPGQVAVQVTGALRNLAVAPSHAPAFLTPTCLAALKASLRVLGGQSEVVLNIGRVLSKLSLHEDCETALEADTEFAPLLIDLLRRHQHHRALLLRLAFALGNLTTMSGAYRQQVAGVPGALELLVNVLQLYTSGAEASDSQQSSSGTTADDAAAAAATPAALSKADRLSRAASREDCLVKLLRLIANLAIDPQVGPKLAASAPLCQCLLTLLQNHRYTCGTEEELVLNAVCSITNVSFYQCQDNKILALEPPTLLVHITPLLLSDNEEAIVEAARVFGNFSRAPHARAYMSAARVLEALVLLLDHSSSEVLYSVCGTLINFSADVQQRTELLRLSTPAHLLDVLERVMGNECGTELEVATLCVVCKALYNMCSEDMSVPAADGSSSPSLSKEEHLTLMDVLSAVCGCQRLMDLPEVPEVTQRLLSQTQQSLSRMS